MAIETSTSTSRRALLAGGLGAIGALVAQAVGRPLPVRAEGETVVVGGEYTTATSRTLIQNFANDNGVFAAGSNAGGTGVLGGSVSGIGVHGTSPSGTGVLGELTGDGKAGVHGRSTDTTTAGGECFGVWGESASSYGVHGEGGAGGVAGVSASGTGVFGSSSAGSGVWGISNLEVGVYGQSGQGVGVYARAEYDGDGVALAVDGRLHLKTSGVATIAPGATSVTVDPGVDVVPGSFVLLTPKANLGGRDVWFTTNPTAGTFSIRMSSSRSSATKISWLLVG